ncbi:hypothetical protein A9Q99_02925 [Gammaproteobacteria bacterium 45_16_T64]|nr:hypothetical protein A9Q99_02925 [Gammaproteobacteria bacterium 45_16_T64]
MIGIGAYGCKLAVYIANRPPLESYVSREKLVPATVGELAHIGKEVGNHWRKIINIYGKLGFMLATEGFSTWQEYRDHFLLTGGAKQALLFNECIASDIEGCLHIVMGKAHSLKLLGDDELIWVDSDFAISRERRIIVTPYFDYRQLSNMKLEKLVGILKGFD